MIRILSIDTTSEFGSLALVEATSRDREGADAESRAGALRSNLNFAGAEVRCEMPLYSKQGFSQVLFASLRELLDRNGWTLAMVDAFAAASGPGSFTGVRVGLAAAKGLADSLSKPAFGISNLEALASFGSAPLRAPLIDAHRDQVYAAIYDTALRPVASETVANLPDWLKTLPEAFPAQAIEFISNLPGLAQVIIDTPFASACILPAPNALAGAIGKIAAARLLAGEDSSPAALDANYVRRSDAEIFWRG